MPNPIDSRSHRRFRTVLFMGCLAIGPVAVFAAADLPKEIASRLAAKWLVEARHIRTPEHVIYYHGSAAGGTARDGRHWTGEIEGEILVLTPRMAIACSKVRLGPAGRISIQGTQQTQLADGVPLWKKALEQHP